MLLLFPRKCVFAREFIESLGKLVAELLRSIVDGCAAERACMFGTDEVGLLLFKLIVSAETTDAYDFGPLD